MAPRLLPSFSKMLSHGIFIDIIDQELVRHLPALRRAASEGWSRPSTENTPRICANWLGTSRKGARPADFGKLVE